MARRTQEQVKRRRQATISGILVIAVDPGDKIFDTSDPVRPKLLGIVGNGLPVVNEPARTVYLSNDDYDHAKHYIQRIENLAKESKSNVH